MMSVLESSSPPRRVTSASARSPFAEKTAEAEALKTLLAESGAFSRMMLTAEERVAMETDFGWDTQSLLRNLVEQVKTCAVPPISSFYVGVAGLGETGNVYFGCNLEFLGERIGATIHGEQFMLANAFFRKESRIVMFAVNAAPCGHCRQFINELPLASDIRVLIGPDVNETFEKILPFAFGPADLGSSKHFLDAFDHRLALQDTSLNSDPLVQAALEAAQRAYSPYTRSPSGVALLCKGKVVCGSYVENAAYNPSLPPMQAALVSLRASGVTEFNQIERAIVVECKSAPLHQKHSSRELLAVVAPDATFDCVYAILSGHA